MGSHLSKLLGVVMWKPMARGIREGDAQCQRHRNSGDRFQRANGVHDVLGPALERVDHSVQFPRSASALQAMQAQREGQQGRMRLPPSSHHGAAQRDVWPPAAGHHTRRVSVANGQPAPGRWYSPVVGTPGHRNRAGGSATNGQP